MDIADYLNAAADLVEGHDMRPFYNRYGDCIHCMLKPVGTWAERVGDVITIYRSIEDDTPVGYQIKGVMALLNAHQANHLQLDQVAGADGEELTRVQVTVMQVADLALEQLYGAMERGPNRTKSLMPFFDLVEQTSEAELVLA